MQTLLFAEPPAVPKYLISFPDKSIKLATIAEYLEAMHKAGHRLIDWYLPIYQAKQPIKLNGPGNTGLLIEEFRVVVNFDIRPEIKAFIDANPAAFFLLSREVLDGPYAPRDEFQALYLGAYNPDWDRPGETE